MKEEAEVYAKDA